MKLGECESCVSQKDMCISTCPDCVVKHAKHHQDKARAEIVSKLRERAEIWETQAADCHESFSLMFEFEAKRLRGIAGYIEAGCP